MPKIEDNPGNQDYTHLITLEPAEYQFYIENYVGIPLEEGLLHFLTNHLSDIDVDTKCSFTASDSPSAQCIRAYCTLLPPKTEIISTRQDIHLSSTIDLLKDIGAAPLLDLDPAIRRQVAYMLLSINELEGAA